MIFLRVNSTWVEGLQSRRWHLSSFNDSEWLYLRTHMCAIDKSGVPKEAQDDALSDGINGSRHTPPWRPTRDEVY